MSFKRLDPEDISISAESVVTPLWSTNSKLLTSFFTSSTQVASTGEYFHRIYNTDINLVDTAVAQMGITYGDKDGKGSVNYNGGAAGKSPSSTIYGQYRNLVFGDEDTNFTFQGQSSDYIYVISIDRARYKEKLLPGSFNLTLSGSGAAKIRLTDNSETLTTISYVDSGRVYDIISGSNGYPWDWNGTTATNGYNTTGGSYGKYLPDVGIIILNGEALDDTYIDGGLALATARTASPGTDEENIKKFYNAISGGAYFESQAEETVSSNYIFVRVRNSEFNYSTNPSNITGSGELRHDIMINTPQAYITTVGLYNDNNDLLAVAKLSKPLLKDFTKEALVRIKLDY
jgi:hypothetical protein